MSVSRSRSSQSGLQALIDLARSGRVELRPTLLRVLTDQFIQEPVHTPLERARFSELVCRLLDNVDPSTRAAVAERLAAYPGTPAVVASRLARDDIAVAEPVLRRSPALGEAELHAILDSCGLAHAIAIKSRSNLPASVARRLQKVGETSAKSVNKSSTLPGAPSERAKDGPELTVTLARRYLLTETDERKLILKAMPACPPLEGEEKLRRTERNLADQLERAALRHQAQEFALLLRRFVGLPADVAARIVSDPAGDPLLVVCRALEIPFGATSRILLFLNPAIGASVQQVFGLAEWFEAIHPAAARRLVSAWCALGTAQGPRHSGSERGRLDRDDHRPPAMRGTVQAGQIAFPRAAVNES